MGFNHAHNQHTLSTLPTQSRGLVILVRVLCWAISLPSKARPSPDTATPTTLAHPDYRIGGS
jgi:hypothetical protein